MKTNNVMVRPMGQFHVEQRTKDGMFNATALLKQWNLNTQNSGDFKKRDLDNFWKVSGLKDFMAEVAENECNLKSVEFTELKNALSTTSRGKYSNGTWMHPILFVKFAMWLSPRFEYQVIKFVYDQMIKYRNEAGDAYKELGAAVSKIVDKSFMPVAMSNISKGINYIVFNDHYSLIRNDRGEEQMQRDLFDMERKVADLINDGFLKRYEDVINYLRLKWREKHTPGILQ